MPIGTVASAQTPRILAREYCSLIDSYPGATPKRVLCYQTGSGPYSPKCIEGGFSEVRIRATPFSSYPPPERLSIFMKVVNQQGDEHHWDQDVQIKRYPCVVRCVVRFDHYTPDVHHGISQPPHRETNRGSNPEISPHPVAEDAQNTYGQVRHGHFALKGIARRPADG